MEPSDVLLLETAAKNFDDIDHMTGDQIAHGDGMRRMCLGLVQFARASKHLLGDPFKQMLAETAARNFGDAGHMTNDEITRGDCLRRIVLGLAQLSRAMKGL
jgi:hypothetical protein